MSDAYEVVGGSLKLKGVKDGGVTKKLAFFESFNCLWNILSVFFKNYKVGYDYTVY